MFDGAYPPGVTGKMIDDLEHGCCCGNCRYYNGTACTAGWNNAEEGYYNPELDNRDPDDYCDDWEGEEE